MESCELLFVSIVCEVRRLFVQAEMNVLRKTESDLTRGKENLVEMLSGLEFEKVFV